MKKRSLKKWVKKFGQSKDPRDVRAKAGLRDLATFLDGVREHLWNADHKHSWRENDCGNKCQECGLFIPITLAEGVRGID